MLKGYKYRIYPTPQQEVLLAKHFGCCRMVYNLGLQVKQMAYSGAKVALRYTDLSAQLTDLKKEYTWLAEVNSQSLQSQLRNLDASFNSFFKGTTKFPNFKKKEGRQSFQCTQGVSIKNGLVFLPKFREGIAIVLHRQFQGDIRTVTVSQNTTGKYFVSVLVDDGSNKQPKKSISESNCVGVDLGIKTFAVCSEGEEYAHPKCLSKSAKRLAVLQRRLSRKKKGSNNRKKARIKVARAHEKIANQRNDFLHKVSNEITNHYDTICIENLQVRNMVKNRRLAKSISDSGWGMFVGYLKYKCEHKGKNILTIGTFDPSSKTCSTCGYIKKDLSLSDRNWRCPSCSTEHDRDVNAAKNIKAFALHYSGQELSGGPVELPTLVGAMKQEKKRLLPI